MKIISTISNVNQLELKDFNNIKSVFTGSFGFIFNGNLIAVLYSETDNSYELPGGKLEGKESPKEGLKREIIEEIGYYINIEVELGVFREINTITGTECFSHLYKAKVSGVQNDLKLTNYETKRKLSIKWMTIEEYKDILISNKSLDSRNVIKYMRDKASLKLL